MRVVRTCGALAGTVVVGALGLAGVVVGGGRHLEDACITEPPASFARESTVLQGPIRQGPVTFRCEVPGEPGVRYVFTDAVPLVWTLAVVAATLAAVTVLWFWALHRPRNRDQPAPA